jgi:hypothetical protein
VTDLYLGPLKADQVSIIIESSNKQGLSERFAKKKEKYYNGVKILGHFYTY